MAEYHTNIPRRRSSTVEYLMSPLKTRRPSLPSLPSNTPLRRPRQRRNAIVTLTAVSATAIILITVLSFSARNKQVRNFQNPAVIMRRDGGASSSSLQSSEVWSATSVPLYSSSTVLSSLSTSTLLSTSSDPYNLGSTPAQFSTSSVYYPALPTTSSSSAPTASSISSTPSSSSATNVSSPSAASVKPKPNTTKVTAVKSRTAKSRSIKTTPAKSATIKSTKATTAPTKSMKLKPAKATTLVNPVAMAYFPEFLGNVTSNNTYDVRDCGWQGNIGSTWITTFADTVPCKYSNRTGCYSMDASNSAAIALSPTSYQDIVTGPKGQHVTGPFCGRIDGEEGLWGVWLSNVVEVSETVGVTYFMSFNRTQGVHPIGGGIGIIDTAAYLETGQMPKCERQDSYWWDLTHEPFYGDHGAVVGPDGFIYAFGGAPRLGSGNYLFLTRVKQQDALMLAAYEYWNGSDWTSDRLVDPTVAQSVLFSGQGSVVYSPYYGFYMYFFPDCVGGCIGVRVSERPEGPWTTSNTFWGSNHSPDGYAMYAPAVQPQWSDPEMKSLVIMYTGYGVHNGGEKFGNILQAINVTFAELV